MKVVLDMGEPVTILDLARKMVALSGLTVRDEYNPNGDIAITFSGLRPGEKLYEELLIGDNPESTSHPKIRRANEVYLRWSALLPVLGGLREAVRRDDYEAVREILLSTVQGYEPPNGIVDLLYQQHEQREAAAAPLVAVTPPVSESGSAGDAEDRSAEAAGDEKALRR